MRALRSSLFALWLAFLPSCFFQLKAVGPVAPQSNQGGGNPLGEIIARTPLRWDLASVFLDGDIFQRANGALGARWSASGITLQNQAAAGDGAAFLEVMAPADGMILVDYALTEGSLTAWRLRAAEDAVGARLSCHASLCTASLVALTADSLEDFSAAAARTLTSTNIASFPATGTLRFTRAGGQLTLAVGSVNLSTSDTSSATTEGRVGFSLGGGAQAKRFFVRDSANQALVGTIGDSISVGTFSKSSIDLNTNFVPYNWSGGTAVNSQGRMLADAFQFGFSAYSVASNGAHASDMGAQADQLIASATNQRLDYATILIGANDLCHGDPNAFNANGLRASIEQAVAHLAAADTHTRIVLAGLPNLTQLTALQTLTPPQLQSIYSHLSNPFDPQFATSVALASAINQQLGLPGTSTTAPTCAQIYQAYCPNLQSTHFARNIVDYNAMLADLAADYPQARFVPNDLTLTAKTQSAVDCFHPSGSGQALDGQNVTAGADGQSLLSQSAWVHGWFNR